MLLLGALTNTNPVVDGFGVFDLSLANFVTVLGNPNVHLALANSLIACTGGTALAVIIGLTFSWIVVRTNTPWRGFVAPASLIPLFVPPLVAGVAWSILGSPKSGLINTMMGWAGLPWRIDLYSMTGLIVVFGMPRTSRTRPRSSRPPGSHRNVLRRRGRQSRIPWPRSGGWNNGAWTVPNTVMRAVTDRRPTAQVTVSSVLP